MLNQTVRVLLFILISISISLFFGVFVVHRYSLTITKALVDNYRFLSEPPPFHSDPPPFDSEPPSSLPEPPPFQQFTLRTSSQIVASLCDCDKEIRVTTDDFSTPSEVFHWCSPVASMRGRHQKVIAYTIYGNMTDISVLKRYYSLLHDIAVTAEKEYPGWNVRIYHNFTEERKGTPEERGAHEKLCDVYCKFHHVDLCSVPLMVKSIGNNSTNPIDPALFQQGLNPKMYRYLVTLDPNVDIFVSRDVDSIIWRREVDAVEEWLRSKYTFHLMRDSTAHGSIILAGMWGAKLYQRRDLIQGLMRAIAIEGQNHYTLMDQSSLDKILWPVAKYDVMAHDSYHCENEKILKTSALKVFPFPTKRAEGYVGGVGRKMKPDKCPEACRPANHKDWDFC